MYEFDMQALLAEFDNDPEKLANSFADQLNTALTAKRKEEELRENAEHLANSWNTFVREYFEIRHSDQDYQKYLFRDGSEVIAIIELMIHSMAEIEKYAHVFDNINSLTDKLNLNIQNTKGFAKSAYSSAKEALEPTTDEFKRLMKEFFNKNDI